MFNSSPPPTHVMNVKPPAPVTDTAGQDYKRIVNCDRCGISFDTNHKGLPKHWFCSAFCESLFQVGFKNPDGVLDTAVLSAYLDVPPLTEIIAMGVLEVLLDTAGNLTEACARLCIPPRFVIHWRRQNRQLDIMLEQARIDSTYKLQDELLRRAMHGTRKAVWYRGERVGEDIELDNSLLVTELKARKAEYTPRQEMRIMPGSDMKLVEAFMSAEADAEALLGEVPHQTAPQLPANGAQSASDEELLSMMLEGPEALRVPSEPVSEDLKYLEDLI